MVINRIVGNSTKLNFKEDPNCCFHFKRNLKPNYVSRTKNEKPNKNTNLVYGLTILLGCLNEKPNTLTLIKYRKLRQFLV